MKVLPFFLILMAVISYNVLAVGMSIDGLLNEAEYGKITSLKSEISLLYLIPTSDALYIGAEVEDDSINVANPAEFWNMSCVEVWFDWANNNSPEFDKDDQQFWFCPVKGKGNEGYAGQWHRASDNIKDTIYDYANESDMIDMAFLATGKGYTLEVKIGKEAMGGYAPTGTIGFNYSADKGGTKFEWEEAGIGGNFYEKPDTWPDLKITEVVLAIQWGNRLPVLWGGLKNN